jgi:hypothetical protein
VHDLKRRIEVAPAESVVGPPQPFHVLSTFSPDIAYGPPPEELPHLLRAVGRWREVRNAERADFRDIAR